MNRKAEQEDLTDRLHSLEEEVTTMRHQIIAAEGRATLVEQRAEKATCKMSERDWHLARHFGI